MNEQTKKELVAFFSKYNLIKFKKGQIIFKPGEEIPGMAFIKTGFVRIYSVTKDGKELTVPMFKPMLFSSVLQTMVGINNKNFFQAISPVEMWVAPKDEAKKFVDENPEIKEKLTKMILSDFIDLSNNLQKIIYGDAYTKVASLVYSMVNKTDGKDKNIEIKFTTPHRMIASMTGLTRETVTLQLLKLQKDGYLATKGRHLVIKDLQKLEKLASL